MGKIYFGLVLTLLVSLLVMLAGGFLARRAVTKVTPVDRDLLEGFTEEIERVEFDLWEERRGALATLASELSRPIPKEVEEQLEELAGVRGAYLFKEGLPGKEWVLLGPIGSRSLAEVVVEGRKVPLNEKRAVVVPEGLFEKVILSQSGEIANEEGSFLGWWFSPAQGSVVMFLVERERAEREFVSLMAERAGEAFDRLERVGETVAVVFRGRKILGEGVADRSATLETGKGGFVFKAWDRRVEEKMFHWGTMFGSAGLAVVIAGMAFFLFFSQRLMWRESEERVSFVNRVSHELGTPLTNMTLNLELAVRSLRSQPERAGQRLEKVREEVARLGRLVANVLTHSRKTGEGIELRRMRCDADEVIAGVIEQFRPALARRGIVVEWSGSGASEMLMDRDAVSQIVWNLISNGEKYGAGGEWMGVTAEVVGGELKVRVCDRGEGIALAQRGLIFRAFERVHDSTSEGVSGTGLGLSISRDLAEAMGGQLVLVEDPTMTIFELTIPMNER